MKMPKEEVISVLTTRINIPEGNTYGAMCEAEYLQEAIDRAVEALKSEPVWRNAETDLPEKDPEVKFAVGEDKLLTASVLAVVDGRLEKIERFRYPHPFPNGDSRYAWGTSGEVTFWMTLPKLPEKEEENQY